MQSKLERVATISFFQY